MAGVVTTITIRDGVTDKLRRMTAATEKQNRALQVTDTLSEQVAAGANFDRQTAAINRAGNATERLNQKIDESTKKTNRLKEAWGLVGGVIGSAMAAISVRKVIELADNMTSTRARLDLMNDGLQTTAELQAMIQKSANRSRASYQTTADAVSKMGIMAADAFSSNAELIRFTELINKQFAIVGTSAAGIDAAMLQLTQAMSSGVLRGEELNSVLVQAPTIVQTIADYLGVSVGQIRSMAAEGLITSTVVKNAMLSSADEINAKFNSMPMTFGQLWNLMINIAREAFGPLISIIGAGAQWIYDNWSKLVPIFYGLAAAVLVYAAALGIQTVATWIATGAAKAFFVTLLSNPIMYIAILIGVVVGFIYKWIQSVGGLKKAWEICKAALLVAWAAIKIAFFAVYNWIANLIDKIKLIWQKAGVAIADFMGNMKVNILTILQNLINGAIDIINKFIGLLNKIPGVNLSLIEQVTFATTAAAENEAAKQARADELKRYEAELNAAKAERDARYAEAKQELADAADNVVETYKNARAEAARMAAEEADDASSWNYDGPAGADLVNVGDVDRVGSVGAIESDINIAEEDLKFLRDVAEMRFVQNFVTLTPTVAVDAQISEKVDVDEVVYLIEQKLENEFVAAAEGVYN